MCTINQCQARAKYKTLQQAKISPYYNDDAAAAASSQQSYAHDALQHTKEFICLFAFFFIRSHHASNSPLQLDACVNFTSSQNEHDVDDEDDDEKQKHLQN